MARAVKPVLKERTFILTDQAPLTFELACGRNRRLAIFDEKKGTKRAIRHCPNEPSIFIDEQSEYAVVSPIIFERGTLVVKREDQLTQKFLLAHPKFGKKFVELDREQEATRDINYEDQVLDIKTEIRKVAKEDPSLIKAVTASVLGNSRSADELSPAEMRTVLYEEAEASPESYIDAKGKVTMFTDKEILTRGIVLEGQKSGVITTNPEASKVIWGDTKKEICRIPRGKDFIPYFTDYLLDSEDGKLIIDQIKKKAK